MKNGTTIREGDQEGLIEHDKPHHLHDDAEYCVES